MKWTKISKDEDYATAVPGGMVMLSIWGEGETPTMVFVPCGGPTALNWIEEHQFDR